MRRKLFKDVNHSVLTAVLAVLCLGSFALAGSLTPPGAVGSTMNTLAEIYNSITGTFDSTAIVADQNGSLVQHLKYIEATMGSLGVSSNSLDFDEFANAMTVDVPTSINAVAGLTFTNASVSGVLETGIGGSASTGAVSAVICSNTATASTTILTIETLGTCIIPANTLNANGKAIRAIAVFTTAASATTKTAHLQFGATQIVAFGSTINNQMIYLQFYCVRTGPNTQKCWKEISFSNATSGGGSVATTSEIDSGPISVTARGTTPTTPGDVTLQYLYVEVIN